MKKIGVFLVAALFILAFFMLSFVSADEWTVGSLYCGDGNVTPSLGEECDYGPENVDYWHSHGCNYIDDLDECRCDASACYESAIYYYGAPSSPSCSYFCSGNEICKEGICIESVELDEAPRIISLSLSVVEDYKKEYSLSSDYESQGLKEFLFKGCWGEEYVESPCSLRNEDNCESSEDSVCRWVEKSIDLPESDKLLVDGIITNYDPMEIIAEISYSGFNIENYTIEFSIKQGTHESFVETDLFKSLALSKCILLEDGNYRCNVTFNDSSTTLNRGSIIFGEAVLMEEGSAIDELKSNYFITAKYILNVLHVWDDTKDESFSDSFEISSSYDYFNKVSDINKKIEFSMKYVEHSSGIYTTLEKIASLPPTSKVTPFDIKI